LIKSFLPIRRDEGEDEKQRRKEQEKPKRRIGRLKRLRVILESYSCMFVQASVGSMYTEYIATLSSLLNLSIGKIFLLIHL